jgi:hypothetical protein
MSPGFLLRSQSLSDEVLAGPKVVLHWLRETYRLPDGTILSLTPNASLKTFLTAAQDRGYTYLPQLLEALRFGSAGLPDGLIKKVLSEATDYGLFLIYSRAYKRDMVRDSRQI